jgi:hypothetical protein
MDHKCNLETGLLETLEEPYAHIFSLKEHKTSKRKGTLKIAPLHQSEASGDLLKTYLLICAASVKMVSSHQLLW